MTATTGERLDIGVVGLGLIGGSFAIDMMARGHGVVGHDADATTCAVAMDTGMVHQASTDIAVLDDCGAIMVAVPVGTLGVVMGSLAGLDMPNLRVVFDASSVKRLPLAAADRLGPHAGKFVACHPIAGAADSGVRSARDGLYAGKRVLICDLPATDRDALATARSLWEETGAQVATMPAAEHDRLFATVSHLPHLLAFALMGMVGARQDRDQLLELAGSAFTDMTRLAGSDPAMWRDISMANRDNLLTELDAYSAALAALRASIAAEDSARLHDTFADGRKLRHEFLSHHSS